MVECSHRLSWRVQVGYAGFMACSILILSVAAGYGQPQDSGIILLKDEAIRAQLEPTAHGGLILEPLQLSASLGDTSGGVFWTEFSAKTGLWLGEIHMSSMAALRDLAFSLSVEVETQLSELGLTAGVHWSSGGAQLSGGLRTAFENFTVVARVDMGTADLSVNVDATTKLGDLDLYAGADLTGSQLGASAGTTLPLIGNLMTLSARASIGRKGLALTGGTDLVLSNSLSLSVNANVGTRGFMTTIGGQMNFDSLKISAHGVWSAAGLEMTANGQISVAPMTLFLTLRVDTDSFSIDLAAQMAWGILTPKLTVRLDQQGFKWHWEVSVGNE